MVRHFLRFCNGNSDSFKLVGLFRMDLFSPMQLHLSVYLILVSQNSALFFSQSLSLQL